MAITYQFLSPISAQNPKLAANGMKVLCLTYNQEAEHEMSTCENCGAKATVYAMGPYAGDWAGYYCDLHIPTGFRVTDKIKN